LNKPLLLPFYYVYLPLNNYYFYLNNSRLDLKNLEFILMVYYVHLVSM